MKPKPPKPHFVPSLWYEQVAHIMRTDPARFRLFSPVTKKCLALYLDWKREAEQMKEAA